MIGPSWVYFYSDHGKEAHCLEGALGVAGRGGLSQDIYVVWGFGLSGGLFQCGV